MNVGLLKLLPKSDYDAISGPLLAYNTVKYSIIFKVIFDHLCYEVAQPMFGLGNVFHQFCTQIMYELIVMACEPLDQMVGKDLGQAHQCLPL